MPIGYPGNSVSKAARAKSGGGFESAVEVVPVSDSVTVTGTGFGPEPNVVLWRNFEEGADGDALSSVPPSGQIGELEQTTMKYTEFGGRKAGEGFSSGVKQLFEYIHQSAFTRYRHFISLAVPDTGVFPGANNTGFRSFSTDSGCKPAWLMNTNDGFRTGLGYADIVLPTHTGNGNLRAGGNSVDPVFFRFKDSSEDFWQWNEFNSFGYVCPSDLTSPKTQPVEIELFMTSSKIGTNVKTKTIAGFAGGDDSVTDQNTGFDRVRYNSYSLDAGGNAQMLYSDPYLAVESSPGANDFVQCAFLGDAAVYSNCTELRPVKASSWTDTEVIIPNPYALPYYHIIKPDGTVVSGVA